MKQLVSRKAAIEAQQAQDIARRNRVGGTTEVIFKDVTPVVALLNAAPAPAPAKAASAASTPANDMTRVLKTMTDGFASMAAALKGPAAVQKAAPAVPVSAVPAPAPAVAFNTPLASVEKRARTATIAAEAVQKAPQRASTVVSVSGNEPHVPLETEGQRRRAAEARAQAQRAAERVAADRELVTKGTARVTALRQLDVKFSNAALVVLGNVITAWEAAARRPIPVSFSKVADAVGLSSATVRDAVAELVESHALIRTVDSVGTARFMPTPHVTGGAA